jgi:hypothetical protein
LDENTKLVISSVTARLVALKWQILKDFKEAIIPARLPSNILPTVLSLMWLEGWQDYTCGALSAIFIAATKSGIFVIKNTLQISVIHK